MCHSQILYHKEGGLSSICLAKEGGKMGRKGGQRGNLYGSQKIFCVVESVQIIRKGRVLCGGKEYIWSRI